MNWLQEITNNKSLYSKLVLFLTSYGVLGLEQALKLYTDMQQTYICSTKRSTSKIPISEIYYIDILGHNITIHTASGDYQKYGTLNKELKALSDYNFIKCNQSCIVALSKIESINYDQIILKNKTAIHMSRNCAPKVIMAFHDVSNKR